MPEIIFKADQGTGVRKIIRIMQGDTRSHVIRFVVPRYDSGVDLAPLVWYIKFVDAEGVSDIALPSAMYEVTADDIRVRWTVNGISTDAAGNTKFQLHGVGKDAEGHVISWTSGAGEIEVTENIGFEVSDEDEEKLTALDELIVFVQGELNGVIAAGNNAAAAATAADSAAARAEAAAEGAVDATAAAIRANEAAEAAENAAANANNVMDVKANALAATAEGNPVQVHPDEGSLLKPVTELKPIQPGSGDPYPAGGGKNLLPFMVKGKTFSANGMTAEVKDEGLVVNGTPSGSYNNLVNYELSLPAGTYTISGGDASKGVIAQMNVTNADGSASYYINTTFEVKGTEQRIVVMIQNGGGTPTMTNYVLKAQLERGSTATEFALYENIRPISGRTGAELTRCGKNLLDNIVENRDAAAFHSNGDGVFVCKILSNYILPKPVLFKAGQTYTISLTRVSGTGNNPCIVVRNPSGDTTNQKHNYGDPDHPLTFSFDVDTEWNIMIQSASVNGDVTVGDSWAIQLELGSTATPFEPYQGDTFTLDFGQTVCGGVLDWNTGLLTVEWALETITGVENVTWKKNSNWNAGSWYCGVLLPGAEEIAGFDTVANMVCSHAPVKTPGIVAASEGCIGYGNGTNLYVNFGAQYNTVELLKGFFAAQHTAGTPVQVAYKLATPVTIQLTPVQIPALEGANTLYTDGDGMTVDYNRSIADAYEELRNAIIAMGGYV